MKLLDARAEKATALAAALRELSDTQAERIRAAAAVYNAGRYNPDINVSTLREDVKHASSVHIIEELRVQGEVDALRVEIAQIDAVLSYLGRDRASDTDRVD